MARALCRACLIRPWSLTSFAFLRLLLFIGSKIYPHTRQRHASEQSYPFPPAQSRSPSSSIRLWQRGQIMKALLLAQRVTPTSSRSDVWSPDTASSENLRTEFGRVRSIDTS